MTTAKAPGPTLEDERNAALVAWYTAEKRPLPWRDTDDPYRVLVSEVMLQQTQTNRVADRFVSFLDRYPTVADLAAASTADVLASWSGLGYNRRAVNLHRAAQTIARHGWPRDVAGLQELPGIGPYTARAIAAFAFGHAEVPVDTNVRRVLSRWHGEPLDGSALQGIAEADRADADAATWAQAVMDLGSTLCTPRSPGCSVCPVFEYCAGPDVYVAPRAQGRFEGSVRQLRGAIVRQLVNGPAGPRALAESSGFDTTSVETALDALAADGIVVSTDGLYRLPD